MGLWWRHSRNWPGIGGGIILSGCPCGDPERQLPTASLRKSRTCVWVGLSWYNRHSPASQATRNVSSAAARLPGGGSLRRAKPAQVAPGGVERDTGGGADHWTPAPRASPTPAPARVCHLPRQMHTPGWPARPGEALGDSPLEPPFPCF